MDNNRRFPLILSSFWLKVIAMLTMTIDHVGYLLQYDYPTHPVVLAMRYIGRIALPLFCFMIAEGAIHTKSFKKYALRLGVMASIISLALIFTEYIPYFRNNGLSMREEGIIFLDLLLGAVSIYFFKKDKWYLKLLGVLPILYGVASFTASSLEYCGCNGHILWFPFFMRTQYGWYSILLIVGFYVAHLLTNIFIKYHSNQSGVNEELYKDSNLERHSLNILSVLMLVIVTLLLYITGLLMPEQNVFWILDVQLYAFIAGAFILLYNGRRGYNKKWFQYGSYLYYPLHLLIVYLIFELI